MLSNYSLIYFYLIVLFCFFTVQSTIIIELNNFNVDKYMHRFWTNTGFCPPAPINKSLDYFLSQDVKINLQIIGSIPGEGIKNVRIHWLLELIQLKEFNRNNIPVYNFTALDEFFDNLLEAGLSPGFEFMGNPSNIFNNTNLLHDSLWEDLSYQIASRYLNRYGFDELLNWKFETWNEPDLLNYNLLNYNKTSYIAYVYALQRGLLTALRNDSDYKFRLLGPAGLFKAESKHQLCWGILEECNSVSQANCPLTEITFHRKGNGTAESISDGTLILAKQLNEQFPNLKSMKFSNNEADPISGWSTPRKFQSDNRYASILIKTVFNHWSAIYNNELANLNTISHDNSFLSYHPHVFNQRTLLARFQMNNTRPKYSVFIQKPVYAALGLLSHLGNHATDVLKKDSINYLISRGNMDVLFYNAILLTTTENNTNHNISIKLKIKNYNRNIYRNERFAYFIESLQANVTDPGAIWKSYDSPPYPNLTVFNAMRMVQTPHVHNTPKVIKINKNITEFVINLNLQPPWIVLIRICSNLLPKPTKVIKIRFTKIHKNAVSIFWNELNIKNALKCIQTREIYFKEIINTEWQLITHGVHVPFMYYHFEPLNGTIYGKYKIRTVDFFKRKSTFSKIYYYLQ